VLYSALMVIRVAVKVQDPESEAGRQLIAALRSDDPLKHLGALSTAVRRGQGALIGVEGTTSTTT